MAFSSATANCMSRSGTKEVVEYVEGKLNCSELFNQVSRYVDLPCVSQHFFYINKSPVNPCDNYQPSPTIKNHPDNESMLKCTATVVVDYPDSNSRGYGIYSMFDAKIIFSIPERSKYHQWKVIAVVDKLQVFGHQDALLIHDCIGNKNTAEDLLQQDLNCTLIGQNCPYYYHSYRYYTEASSLEKVYFRLKCTITIPENPR